MQVGEVGHFHPPLRHVVDLRVVETLRLHAPARRARGAARLAPIEGFALNLLDLPALVAVSSQAFSPLLPLGPIGPDALGPLRPDALLTLNPLRVHSLLALRTFEPRPFITLRALDGGTPFASWTL